MQDLSRKKFPCKIFQGKHFLARSCKEQISLQDLTSNCIFTRILQDPCKERIFSRPGRGLNFFQLFNHFVAPFPKVFIFHFLVFCPPRLRVNISDLGNFSSHKNHYMVLCPIHLSTCPISLMSISSIT